ncbi:conserved Plasmodium protein, unknown function [Plasmodium berghei]|uniref:Uncharacterized protein n=2 Tax=Plasmodium berghei TaxID=5821 RepID=A0A509AMA8_PLABA|nr:conserved protein, unknown function [Plasmodium berghei ANKA]CXI63085.1 conserved Plasmodium protein, unknown function [Plasmodium berghei]SCM23766.1 conserved Plasmodium protein, unknown function [Plasmodium berghei]SCN26764.1 conserved Plasmodium protein, unknown function [Plasmodium berghei]SCO61094.1 conserved Plasmodium protein, unknown function [Plasmodium berghei]SCO63183.1 conserved Plasmodium protein, unknown function [Plasmodium berghei]|eukprot:XP_034422380.1 conserved protein, unknown function [Plasmodium berghei ANKA]
MAIKTEVVDDWSEWLNDDEEEKREDFNTTIRNENDEIQKKILENNMDDIADFLNISDNPNKNKKTTKDNENKNLNKNKPQEKIVTLESTPLNSIKDCEHLGEILAFRIKKSNAKSVAIERFISIILQASEMKLGNKELISLNRKIQDMIDKKEKKQRESLVNKKKPNEVKNSIKNYKDEVDMIYGDISYDEEDYDDADEYLDGF